jgi:hypothetical protein
MSQEMIKQLNEIKGRHNSVQDIADRLGYSIKTLYMWQHEPEKAGRKAREAVKVLYFELFEAGLLGKALKPRKTVLAILRAKFGQGCVGYPQDEIEARTAQCGAGNGVKGVKA